MFFKLAGSLFHEDGPETEKVRGPKVLVRVCEMWRLPCAAERSGRRCWTPDSGVNISQRYAGASTGYRERITYKLCLIVFRCLRGEAGPAYLCEMLTPLSGVSPSTLAMDIIHNGALYKLFFELNWIKYSNCPWLWESRCLTLAIIPIFFLSKILFDSVSATIRDEPHLLPIGKRIQFKIALLVRHCIVGVAPEYLIETCCPVSSSSGRQSLHSASRGDLIAPRAFAISGLHMWKSFPNEIRQLSNNNNRPQFILFKSTETTQGHV